MCLVVDPFLILYNFIVKMKLSNTYTSMRYFFTHFVEIFLLQFFLLSVMFSSTYEYFFIEK